MRCRLAIVGLGTAGAAAAALASARGLDVVGLDAAPLGETGARWLNGVPAWAFEEAGLATPTGPELCGADATFHLVGGWGPHRVTLRGPLEVDMRHLTSRLQSLAADQGARLCGDTRVTSFGPGFVETTAGRVEADVVLDASGLSGLNLMRQPRIPREDLCVAEQGVFALADPSGARNFLSDNRAQPGEVVCYSGVAGGYSIVNVRVDLHEGEVAILTGSIPALGFPSGPRLVASFRERNPWVGDRVLGGSRAIPLQRPWTCIGRGTHASIGDSAGMVHSAHGSGIAMQLLAARLLADTLASGGSAWDYNVAWQRRWGGLLAGADAQRRFVQSLSTQTVSALIEGGVLSAELLQGPLQQRPPRPPPAALLRAGAGVWRTPHVLRRLVPALVRGEALEQHYRRYPSEESALPRWRRRLEALAGVG